MLRERERVAGLLREIMGMRLAKRKEAVHVAITICQIAIWLHFLWKRQKNLKTSLHDKKICFKQKCEVRASP